ncbi:MAG: type II secretion system F family protein [Candidatus Chisholmbacteria bacterium]|nr:type II secretion system F family protein [Candidatus Chisholmbacteria bacterium]
MEKFFYTVKNAEGKTIKGQIEARDEKVAVELLRKRELFVVKLKPKTDGRSIAFLDRFIDRVTHRQVTTFTRQLATMVVAGLSVTDSLVILESQTERKFGRVVAQILRDVEGGLSFAAALERHPLVFSKVYIALVRVGEAAGALDQTLGRLAETMEKQEEFKAKVKGALIYPSIVLTGMVVVAIVMLVFVIPRLTSLYQDFGAELPATTQVLINTSKFTNRFWYLFLALVILSVMAFRSWLRTPRGKHKFDLYLLRIPIAGPLRGEVILTEFTRTMALLVSAGISIVEALTIVKEALDSTVFQDSLGEAVKSVEKGFPLAATLAREPYFPAIVPQMIAVGEETGKLDEVLTKLSRYFEEEAEQKIKGLTTAIEPLIMIVLGFGVGFLVIAVILPIYNLTSQF